MRLLFLPYKPTPDAVSDAFAGPKITHQKHAAREHHRKAKLAKQGSKSNQKVSNHNSRGSKESKGQFIEWKVDDEQEKRRPNPSPKTFLGAGRLDPFDAYCATKQPLMVHEMLDHGKCFPLTLLSTQERLSNPTGD